MDVQPLQDIIGKYKYGKGYLLDGTLQVKFNPGTGQLMIDQFYRNGQNPTEGLCSELVLTAYSEIRNLHPSYHLTNVFGHDTEFFAQEGNEHQFLFASEGDLMSGKPIIDNAKEISDVLEQDPLIVDPTFNRIIRFSESGYAVNALVNQGIPMNYSNALIMADGQSIALGIDSNIIFCLAFNTSADNPIGISIGGPNDIPYRLELDWLMKYKEAEKISGIMKYVEFLRRVKIVRTDEEFVYNLRAIIS